MGVADGPADRGNHGKVVKEETLQARSSVGKRADRWSVKTYPSTTSNERVWEDGYIDYVCQYCGLAFRSSRGVGSHKQMHIHEGVVAGDASQGVKKEVTYHEYDEYEPEHRAPRRKLEPQPEPEHQPDTDAERLLQKIKDLLFPDVERQALDLMVLTDQLQREKDELQARYNKVSGDLKALRDLLRGIDD